jgi:hypothetical protein
MEHGPGKYDRLCTDARERTQARLLVLVVIDGIHGSGFSVQARGGPADVRELAALLREMARQIEGDEVNAESKG